MCVHMLGRLCGARCKWVGDISGGDDVVWVMDNMRVDDVVNLIQEIVPEELRNHMMWHNTKYDRNMLMALERDGNVGKLMKCNDAFGYIYIAEKDGLIRQVLTERRVDGELQVGCCGGVKGGGCTGVGSKHGGPTTALALMVR